MPVSSHQEDLTVKKLLPLIFFPHIEIAYQVSDCMELFISEKCIFNMFDPEKSVVTACNNDNWLWLEEMGFRCHVFFLVSLTLTKAL